MNIIITTMMANVAADMTITMKDIIMQMTVFSSWGTETPNKYDKATLEGILKKLAETEEYGKILRSKGMLPCTDGTWMYFDLVPGEYEIRDGKADFTGRICVIGAELKEDALKTLFEIA